MDDTKFLISKLTICDQCNGTGIGNAGPERNECANCGGDGTLFNEVTLTDALRDLGILDRLAALESAVRHSTKD